MFNLQFFLDKCGPESAIFVMKLESDHHYRRFRTLPPAGNAACAIAMVHSLRPDRHNTCAFHSLTRVLDSH